MAPGPQRSSHAPPRNNVDPTTLQRRSASPFVFVPADGPSQEPSRRGPGPAGDSGAAAAAVVVPEPSRSASGPTAESAAAAADVVVVGAVDEFRTNREQPSSSSTAATPRTADDDEPVVILRNDRVEPANNDGGESKTETPDDGRSVERMSGPVRLTDEREHDGDTAAGRKDAARKRTRGRRMPGRRNRTSMFLRRKTVGQMIKNNKGEHSLRIKFLKEEHEMKMKILKKRLGYRQFKRVQ